MEGWDRCPCDRCNGLDTGAWEDDESYEWSTMYAPFEDEYDPYENICPACGEMLEDAGIIHTMELCSEPWYWSSYTGADKMERIKESERKWRNEQGT